MRVIRIGTSNFQENGKGEAAVWTRMHLLRKQLGLAVVACQELPGCAPGNDLWKQSLDVLGMDGRLGPGLHATAVYWDPEIFEHLSTWNTAWPGWHLHPTAVHLRVRGTAGIDVIAASAHLSYNSVNRRRIETDDLTCLADRVRTPEDPRRRKIPLLALGMDRNSYSDPLLAAPGECPVPRPEDLRGDPQHLAHRSYLNPFGERVMDCDTDRTLTTAGLIDACRHLAHTRRGMERAVAETTHASLSQGPGRRIDIIYASELVGPALLDAYTVSTKGLSDHDIVVVELDLDVLIDLYCDYFALVA
ncbi:hypothetical protein [Streptomyces iconiensis]|uniref:Endonuclease/Exonuclease/phosphatase family protein n=1 Tax=Streptomyces iconiensis TaxID=1384038 RepID=A0ABT7A4J8_9ACTN|nr:hypothetical protein [Streptomyces iconiensis]MDJ1136279.1 hypothetical protein [Streptomyces iconiensis]